MVEPAWEHDLRFEGDGSGCGEILLDLKLFFRPLATGTRVLIVNHDGGAPIEMPAWCRLSGNVLLAAAHPYYLVSKR